MVPWDRIWSNYDWEAYSKVKFVKGYEKSHNDSTVKVNLFHIDLVCPKQENSCVLKIPSVVKFWKPEAI